MTPRGINQREADVAQSFTRTVDKVIEIAPELVLIGGDVFHQVRPSNTAILHAFQQFSRLRRALPDTEIVMVAGNHDMPRSLEQVCILRLFAPMGIRVVDTRADAIDFPHLDLQVLGIPGLHHDLPRLEPTGARTHNVLLLHGEVEGMYGPDASFAPPPTGTAIPQDELHLDEWSYVALGHYHVFRPIGKNQFYSGAIDYTTPFIWGELEEEERVLRRAERVGVKVIGDAESGGKGIIEHDLSTQETRFHLLPRSREFVDLPVVSGRGRTAEEVDADIRGAVESHAAGIDDKVVRLVVQDIQRHVTRQLDHRQIREYRRRALHFVFDPRRPDLIRSSATGAPGRRPSLIEVVRDKLRERVLPKDVDRDALVELGIQYLKDAEERESAAAATSVGAE